MEPQALLLHRPDQPFHHAVLLWRMWTDELLLESVAVHRARVASTGEHQAIVGAYGQIIRGAPQDAVAPDQGLLESRLCRNTIPA